MLPRYTKMSLTADSVEASVGTKQLILKLKAFRQDSKSNKVRFCKLLEQLDFILSGDFSFFVPKCNRLQINFFFSLIFSFMLFLNVGSFYVKSGLFLFIFDSCTVNSDTWPVKFFYDGWIRTVERGPQVSEATALPTEQQPLSMYL